MHTATSRRSFLISAAAAAAGVSLWTTRAPADFYAPLSRKKSLIGAPTAETLDRHRAAGFDGIESTEWSITPETAAEQRALAEARGMRVHSVLRGWTNFNSPQADQVAQDIASVETALRACQGYAADALLLVPCRLLTDVTLPKPEDFEIEFNDRTGHVTRVVAGDNSPFQPYIQAQNEAIDMSRKALEKLIPTAEKTGVVIALENVWSNLWVKPTLFAHFVGNHVKYAPPEDWVRELGKTIVKLHVKDFVIDRAAPAGGQFVDIRDGQVNWPAVMQELDKIEYAGWLTIEGSGGLSLEEQNRRLDLILAGK
jgi:hexulose-6-phosphate isomerase